jgi:hypothetical protein
MDFGYNPLASSSSYSRNATKKSRVQRPRTIELAAKSSAQPHEIQIDGSRTADWPQNPNRCNHREGERDCRYPEDQVPPRTSSRSRQKVRHANHTHLRVVNLSINCMAQASSGTATCPTDPAPAVWPGAAPGPPRVLCIQLPLTGPGKLRSRHMSCGLSSRCPARGSSGAAMCPAASAPAAQPGAAPGPPRVLWTQLLLPIPG